MDAYLDSLNRPRRSSPSPSREQLGLALDEEIPTIAPPREPEPWVFVPSADGPVFDELVQIARTFAQRNGAHGVTVGEVVYEYERSGRRHGGIPMENKSKEQRQTSWNPRIMPAAGLVASEAKPRPSPVKRQHKHRHTVWVLPAFAANQESAA